MEWGISDMLATLEATLFVNKTVGELLFEGYEDEVLKMGKMMEDDANMDKFGWFYNVSIEWKRAKKRDNELPSSQVSRFFAGILY